MRSELEYLRRLGYRTHCRGCHRHWLEVLKKFPPPFPPVGQDSVEPSSYFAWTVRAHNEINRRLGKKLIDLSTAKRMWNV